MFFFNDTATTEIYTLSLHDALPIWRPFKTERGIVGGSGRAYNLLRHISIVSLIGILVNKELTLKEHITSLLRLYILAQSAKLNESLMVDCFVKIWLKYAHKTGSQVIIISVIRGKNRMEWATLFMNVGKGVEPHGNIFERCCHQ